MHQSIFAYKLYIRTILKGRHYIVNFTLKTPRNPSSRRCRSKLPLGNGQNSFRLRK